MKTYKQTNKKHYSCDTPWTVSPNATGGKGLSCKTLFGGPWWPDFHLPSPSRWLLNMSSLCGSGELSCVLS